MTSHWIKIQGIENPILPPFGKRVIVRFYYSHDLERVIRYDFAKLDSITEMEDESGKNKTITFLTDDYTDLNNVTHWIDIEKLYDEDNIIQ